MYSPMPPSFPGTQSFITTLSYSLAYKLLVLYEILIGWFQTRRVQTFQPLIQLLNYCIK